MSSSADSGSTSRPTQSPPSTSAFERWRRRAALVTGVGVTHEERMQDLQELNVRRCEKMKADLMESSPLIVFMLRHLRLSGCQVPERNIFCAPCSVSLESASSSSASPLNSSPQGGSETPLHPSQTTLHAASYVPAPVGAVHLCAGHFFSKQHVESSLAHELIHMFDECRFKVDWNNLRHHACSEIRANNLSGDCRYTRELRRGIVSFTKQHQACVRRRAITSVTANPACPSPAHAEKVVNEVWESCFSDTRPFDEVY